MSASDNLGPMFHGTRAENLGGFVFPGALGAAWATSDPEAARAYGATKVQHPGDSEKPVKVYRVSPVQADEVKSKPGEREGETHYVTRQGFMINGEHK